MSLLFYWREKVLISFRKLLKKSGHELIEWNLTCLTSSLHPFIPCKCRKPEVYRRIQRVQDQRNFQEDCNKFKDLVHLRSFIYDFHIRQIEQHLTGRHSVFNKGYPVHKLMELILEEYPKAPGFSRCILTDGMCLISPL